MLVESRCFSSLEPTANNVIVLVILAAPLATSTEESWRSNADYSGIQVLAHLNRTGRLQHGAPQTVVIGKKNP